MPSFAYVYCNFSYVKSKRTPGQGSETELTSSSCLSEESIFDSMLRGPRPLCTLLLVKPDVVKQWLSKLLRRLAQEGFVVVAMRLESLSEDLAIKVIPEEDKQVIFLSNNNNNESIYRALSIRVSYDELLC